MSSVWRVCERAELGQVGRRWELDKSRPLDVGRSSDSDIQVQSQSVENRHAVLEWNQKMSSFSVRDLGGVNGTYVNNRPVRGGSAMLNHGDVVRFGYEKTRVFRIEETFPSPARSPARTTKASNDSSVTTRTPPPPRDALSTPNTPSPLTPTVAATPTYASQPAAFATPQPLPQPLPQPQAVIVPHYVPQQSPVPFVMPQYGYSGSPTVSLHSAPVGHVTIPHAGSAFQPISPTQFLQLSTSSPTQMTSSDSPPSVEDIEASVEEPYLKPQRSDGRRAVELSNSPNLSKVSKLFGKPSWCADDEPTTKETEQEFEFVKPGSQILRDYDRRSRSTSCVDPLAGSGNNRQQQRLSVNEDLRFQAMSNSRDCPSPASTWVVDCGNGDSNAASTKKRPSRLDRLEHRPRSADPSPSRSPQIKKDLLPPTTVNLKRSSSTTRSPSASPKRSPVVTSRPSSATIKKKGSGRTEKEQTAEPSITRSRTVVKKPPTYGSLPRTKTVVKRTTPTGQTRGRSSSLDRVRRSSLEHVKQASDVKEAKKPTSGGTKKTASKKAVNDTYVTEPLSSSADDSQSQSDVSLSSSNLVVAAGTPSTAGLKSASAAEMQGEGGGGEGGGAVNDRPNSARKQWTSDQSQVPDGLMLASIEARIRRLSKLAHTSSRQLSCLQRSLVGVAGIVVNSIPPTSPLGTQKGAEQRLPEWRFHKEGDSIFRGMRTIEKWLKDIQATVNSIQIGGGDDGGVVNDVRDCPPTDSPDYEEEFDKTESEVEAILKDSIEEFYSFSDSDQN